MPQRKDTDNTVSPEANEQIQHILEQIHTIADNLHESDDEDEATDAIAAIDDLPSATQLALLKALSRQKETDAADILLAVNELSDDKIIRKEARRALIRLEEAKIQPAWEVPIAREPMIQIGVVRPPRFWKGLVTLSREEGEIQLVLCWEQGYDYGEARVMTFLLDFWERGLKDFIYEEMTKRNVDARIQQMKQRLPDIVLADCTLAEGRRLIEEALAVNQWRGTTPHEEYRHHLPTVRQLVFNAEDAGEDRGLTFINPTLEPDEVTATFIGGWSLGDYGLAYDLLTRDSALKQGMTRDEWLERHHAWANEAKPSLFELNFVREREVSRPAIWIPGAFGANRSSTRREIEIGWSLEIHDTQLSGTLREMPMGTAVYKETGRHWFLTSYTLEQENKAWRIQSMNDEGANAQGMSIEELQQRIESIDTRNHEITQMSNLTDEQKQTFAEELTWRMIEALHYDDALIVKLPLDRSLCEDAFTRAMTLRLTERSLVYLDRMANRFAEQKGGVLRQIGVEQQAMSEYYLTRGMTERSRHFAALAEQSMRESLTYEDSIMGHAALAEILMDNNSDLEEAEQHLQQAESLATTSTERATIEVDFGNIATKRNRYDIALQHYQTAAELDPNLPEVWFRLGIMQRTLERYDDAIPSYQRAIAQEPRDIRPYAELTVIYLMQRNIAQAREIVEQGLRVAPQSAHLLALLASIYQESGNMRKAEATIEQAERSNPELEIVQAVRESIDQAKKQR